MEKFDINSNNEFKENSEGSIIIDGMLFDEEKRELEQAYECNCWEIQDETNGKLAQLLHNDVLPNLETSNLSQDIQNSIQSLSEKHLFTKVDLWIEIPEGLQDILSQEWLNLSIERAIDNMEDFIGLNLSLPSDSILSQDQHEAMLDNLWYKVQGNIWGIHLAVLEKIESHPDLSLSEIRWIINSEVQDVLSKLMNKIVFPIYQAIRLSSPSEREKTIYKEMREAHEVQARYWGLEWEEYTNHVEWNTNMNKKVFDFTYNNLIEAATSFWWKDMDEVDHRYSMLYGISGWANPDARIQEHEQFNDAIDITLLNEKDQEIERKAMLWFMGAIAWHVAIEGWPALLASVVPVAGTAAWAIVWNFMGAGIDIVDTFSDKEVLLEMLKKAWVVPKEYHMEKTLIDNIIAGLWLIPGVTLAVKSAKLAKLMKKFSVSWDEILQSMGKALEYISSGVRKSPEELSKIQWKSWEIHLAHIDEVTIWDSVISIEKTHWFYDFKDGEKHISFSWEPREFNGYWITRQWDVLKYQKSEKIPLWLSPDLDSFESLSRKLELNKTVNSPDITDILNCLFDEFAWVILKPWSQLAEIADDGSTIIIKNVEIDSHILYIEDSHWVIHEITKEKLIREISLNWEDAYSNNDWFKMLEKLETTSDIPKTRVVNVQKLWHREAVDVRDLKSIVIWDTQYSFIRKWKNQHIWDLEPSEGRKNMRLDGDRIFIDGYIIERIGVNMVFRKCENVHIPRTQTAPSLNELIERVSDYDLYWDLNIQKIFPWVIEDIIGSTLKKWDRINIGWKYDFNQNAVDKFIEVDTIAYNGGIFSITDTSWEVHRINRELLCQIIHESGDFKNTPGFQRLEELEWYIKNKENISQAQIDEAIRIRDGILETSGSFSLSRQDFEKNFSIASEIQQWNTGNCYLIAALDAMRRSPHFEAIIRTSVKRFDDWVWKVRVPLMDPNGKIITVQESELWKIRNPNVWWTMFDEELGEIKDSRNFLHGLSWDTGFKILEIAFTKAKFWNNDMISAEWWHMVDVLDVFGWDYFKTKPIKAYEIVWNKVEYRWLSSLQGEQKAELLEIFEKFDPNIHIVTAAHIRNVEVTPEVGALIKKWWLVKRHVYSIQWYDKASGIITLANPWHTSQAITLSFDDFSAVFSSIGVARVDNRRIMQGLQEQHNTF